MALRNEPGPLGEHGAAGVLRGHEPEGDRRGGARVAEGAAGQRRPAAGPALGADVERVVPRPEVEPRCDGLVGADRAGALRAGRVRPARRPRGRRRRRRGAQPGGPAGGDAGAGVHADRAGALLQRDRRQLQRRHRRGLRRADRAAAVLHRVERGGRRREPRRCVDAGARARPERADALDGERLPPRPRLPRPTRGATGRTWRTSTSTGIEPPRGHYEVEITWWTCTAPTRRSRSASARASGRARWGSTSSLAPGDDAKKTFSFDVP